MQMLIEVVYFPADSNPEYQVEESYPEYEVFRWSAGPVSLFVKSSRGWMTSEPDKMHQWIDEDRVHFGDDETSVPCIKTYLSDREYQAPR